MNRRTWAWAFACAWLLRPAAAAGWHDDGHRIVAAIAEERLSAPTRAALAELVGPATLADMATWADDIKRGGEWAWAKSHHYASVDRAVAAFDLARDCPAAGCVVSAIMHHSHTLRNRAAPREDRVTALKFLVHFVGDVHQPLHVGYNHDRGGNDLTVSYRGQATSLHELWDGGLLDSTGAPWRELAAEIARTASDSPAASAPASTLVPAMWAAESLTLTQTQVYTFGAGDSALDDDYVARSRTIAYARLGLAGARLAALLDAVFDDRRPMPFADVRWQASREASGRERWPLPLVAGSLLLCALVAASAGYALRRRARRAGADR